MFDIVSIGSATLDIFLQSSDFPLDYSSIGEKLEVDDLFLSSGGGGTNTAVGFARLGLSSACVSRLGSDLFGRFVLADLQKEQFDQKYLINKDADETDCSIILVNPDGSRTILVHRGKTKIDKIVFPWEILEKTKWLYTASIEGNVELLKMIVDRSAENKVQVVLNPGNRELKEKEKLMPIFSKVKILILNKSEADELGIERMLPHGPEILVITNGRQGVKLFSNQQNLFSESFATSVIDETGAGDAFSSGFVSGLIKNLSLEEALKLGAANGASVTSKLGAKTGLLREDEMEIWMKKKLKVTKWQ